MLTCLKTKLIPLGSSLVDTPHSSPMLTEQLLRSNIFSEVTEMVLAAEYVNRLPVRPLKYYRGRPFILSKRLQP